MFSGRNGCRLLRLDVRTSNGNLTTTLPHPIYHQADIFPRILRENDSNEFFKLVRLLRVQWNNFYKVTFFQINSFKSSFWGKSWLGDQVETLRAKAEPETVARNQPWWGFLDWAQEGDAYEFAKIKQLQQSLMHIRDIMVVNCQCLQAWGCQDPARSD